MALLRRLTVSEQTASHLRTELEQGLRSGVMPGVKQLAKELGVDLVDLDSVWGREYQAAMLAVAHDQFAGVGPALRDLVGTEGVLYDVKGMLGSEADGTL